ncbi:MAG: hypothetical protein WBQ44_18755 [Rhodococcus sp. (in: high G+C Gram-positive bacteria)]
MAGTVVGYVLSDMPRSSSLLDADASYSSIANVVNGVLLVAVVAAVCAASPISGRAQLGAGLASLIVITLGAVGAVPESVAPWTSPAAAGALLGVAALLAGNARPAQATLVLGVVGFGALGSTLDDRLRYIPPATAELGWTANAIPVDQGLPERTLIIVTLAIVTGVLMAFTKYVDSGVSNPRLLVVGVLLPVAGSVAAWVSTAHPSDDVVWYLAIAGLTVVTLLSAFALRGRDGVLILALFATTGAAFGSTMWSQSSWGQVSILFALLILGGAIGYLLPNVYVGLAVLALGPVASLLFDGDLASLASFLLFPFAVGYVVVSALAVTTGVVGPAAVVPFTMMLPVTVYAAGAQLGTGVEVESFVGDSNPTGSALSISGMAVVAVCAAGVATARRRA